jgi:hypothetical protein
VIAHRLKAPPCITVALVLIAVIITAGVAFAGGVWCRQVFSLGANLVGTAFLASAFQLPDDPDGRKFWQWSFGKPVRFNPLVFGLGLTLLAVAAILGISTR